MGSFLILPILFCNALAAADGSAAKSDDMSADHLILRPQDIQWKPLHPGSEIAVISGDTMTEGDQFVLRIRYHGNVIIPPHWHPTDEHITVLRGTFVLGIGKHFDAAGGTELPAGGYAMLKKKMPHFAWSKGDAEVQVHGIGPFTINYINPADDPNKTATPK